MSSAPASAEPSIEESSPASQAIKFPKTTDELLALLQADHPWLAPAQAAFDTPAGERDNGGRHTNYFILEDGTAVSNVWRPLIGGKDIAVPSDARHAALISAVLNKCSAEQRAAYAANIASDLSGESAAPPSLTVKLVLQRHFESGNNSVNELLDTLDPDTMTEQDIDDLWSIKERDCGLSSFGKQQAIKMSEMSAEIDDRLSLIPDFSLSSHFARTRESAAYMNRNDTPTAIMPELGERVTGTTSRLKSPSGHDWLDQCLPHDTVKQGPDGLYFDDPFEKQGEDGELLSETREQRRIRVRDQVLPRLAKVASILAKTQDRSEMHSQDNQEVVISVMSHVGVLNELSDLFGDDSIGWTNGARKVYELNMTEQGKLGSSDYTSIVKPVRVSDFLLPPTYQIDEECRPELASDTRYDAWWKDKIKRDPAIHFKQGDLVDFLASMPGSSLEVEEESLRSSLRSPTSPGCGFTQDSWSTQHSALGELPVSTAITVH